MKPFSSLSTAASGAAIPKLTLGEDVAHSLKVMQRTVIV